ncbi:membrane protein [Photobacterium gaetbulicola]|uniref:Membrane protein n=2 Tax=Photobacterium gaetbulicola TaxID=1295392 RepID=A0A0B9H0M1_9GAMM|nr:peptidoglycan DD-metalloendopeptidase family protein [Photobacterium gaetbulicola]KHT62407.1 membrane protein [Photobacterium gaetbulicola]
MVRVLSSARAWKLAALVVGLMLSGCSNHSPAPVMSLGKDYNSLERGSYRGSYYEVQQGDTLYFISYITGRDVDDIIRSNKLSAPYTIFPGQKLQLWRPKYVAPQYGRAAPVAVAAVPATKTPTKTTSSKPAQPQTAAKSQPTPQPASQQPAPATASQTQNAQKAANKNVDPAPTKEYSQTTKSNKVVTNKPQPSNAKVAKWAWPSKGRVIAKFSNSENGNKGIDIAGQRGQSVNASASGVVVYAGNALRGYGNLVIIKHNDDYLSAYAHNDQVYVKEQQQVSVGQKIASMGSSGTNTVKLHFEIRYKGKSVDPMRYLPR